MADEYYPIDTDVPFPNRYAGVHRLKVAALRNLFKHGEIENSIWLPVRKNQLWRLMKAVPIPGRGYYTAMSEEQGGVSGFRIWKSRAFSQEQLGNMK